MADFAAWLDWLDGRPRVYNPPAVMRANLSKRYLLDLAAAGAPLPPTRPAAADASAIAAAMDAMELAVAVVKPEIGAGGGGLGLVRRDDEAEIAAVAAGLGGACLVQAPVAEIMSAGETSFVFIEGAFTHAVTKRPKPGEIRCQSEHGGSVIAARPPRWAVEKARDILQMTAAAPLYARIDAVVLDESMRLMEVELIEPELFFTYSPDAAARLAGAIVERLK